MDSSDLGARSTHCAHLSPERSLASQRTSCELLRAPTGSACDEPGQTVQTPPVGGTEERTTPLLRSSRSAKLTPSQPANSSKADQDRGPNPRTPPPGGMQSIRSISNLVHSFLPRPFPRSAVAPGCVVRRVDTRVRERRIVFSGSSLTAANRRTEAKAMKRGTEKNPHVRSLKGQNKMC